MGKFSYSYSLTKESFKLVKKDKEILLFPIFNYIVFVAFLLLFYFTTLHSSPEELNRFVNGIEQFKINYYVYILFFYLLFFFLQDFFQASLMIIVNARIHNQNFSFKDGIKGALQHLSEIFILSVAQSTVGFIIRFIFEKSRLLNKIITALMSIAWSIATFFILPVIVLENVSVKDALGRSVRVFKKTWGETVITYFSVRIFLGSLFGAFLIFIYILMNAVEGSNGSPPASPFLFWGLIAIFPLSLMIFSTISSVLNGVLKVVLFNYSKDGTVPMGFDESLIPATPDKSRYFSGDEPYLTPTTENQSLYSPRADYLEKEEQPDEYSGLWKRFLVVFGSGILIIFFIGWLFSALAGGPKVNIQIIGENTNIVIGDKHIIAQMNGANKEILLVTSGSVQSPKMGIFSVIPMDDVKKLEVEFGSITNCFTLGKYEADQNTYDIILFTVNPAVEDKMSDIEFLVKNRRRVEIKVNASKLNIQENTYRNNKFYSYIKPEVYYLVDDIIIIEKDYLNGNN